MVYVGALATLSEVREEYHANGLKALDVLEWE